MRYAQLVRSGALALEQAGIEHARNEVEQLLSAAFHMTVQDIRRVAILDDEVRATPEEQTAYRAMLARRERREPLQHITGHAPFRMLDLLVGPGVFIPRPETEIVVQQALDLASGMARALRAQGSQRPVRVADLCAGSGAIGLSMLTELSEGHARTGFPLPQVWAVEVSQKALAWTERNAERVLHTRALRDGYHLVHGDACSPATLPDLDGTVDLVVSNPPYIPQIDIPEQPEVRDYDPPEALYGGSDDGLRIPEAIVLRAQRLLRHGGALVMEHDISQAQRLAAFAREHGFTDVHSGMDLTGRARFLSAMR